MVDEVDEVFEVAMPNPSLFLMGPDDDVLCLTEENLMADILSCNLLHIRSLRPTVARDTDSCCIMVFWTAVIESAWRTWLTSIELGGLTNSFGLMRTSCN